MQQTTIADLKQTITEHMASIETSMQRTMAASAFMADEYADLVVDVGASPEGHPTDFFNTTNTGRPASDDRVHDPRNLWKPQEKRCERSTCTCMFSHRRD